MNFASGYQCTQNDFADADINDSYLNIRWASRNEKSGDSVLRTII